MSAILVASDRDGFVAQLGSVVEHSPWVAEQAFERGPFEGLADLHAAFEAALLEAGEEAQRAVLLAHPDLAVRTAQAAELTTESASEQAGAGLDRLATERRLALAAGLAEYRARYGFPFIACVRDHGGAGLEELLEARATRPPADELATALREVSAIARHRLADRLKEAA